MTRATITPAEFAALSKRKHAHGVHKPGVMNGIEAEYAAILELRKRAGGDIDWYAFEAITLKLADDTRYTPDFLVMRSDCTLECHETKARWEDDALVKIKVAADKFPFRFIAQEKIAKKYGGGWRAREF